MPVLTSLVQCCACPNLYETIKICKGFDRKKIYLTMSRYMNPCLQNPIIRATIRRQSKPTQSLRRSGSSGAQKVSKDYFMTIRNKLILTMTALTVVAGSTVAAFAAPACTAEPQSKWMTEVAMKKMIADKGFTIKEFKISGICCHVICKSVASTSSQLDLWS